MTKFLRLFVVFMAALTTSYAQSQQNPAENPAQLGFKLRSRGISDSQAISNLISKCEIPYREFSTYRRYVPAGLSENQSIQFIGDSKYSYYKSFSIESAQIYLNQYKRSTANDAEIRSDICTLETLISMGASASSSPPAQPQVTAAKPAPTAADTQRYQREAGVFNAINGVDRELMADPNLSAQQKSLQSIWSIRQKSAAIARMPESTITPQIAELRTKLQQVKDGRVRGCSDVADAAERNTCISGAFFGSGDQLAVIARAGKTNREPPTLKRRPTDNVNRCLTVDMVSLFGGFKNSCDFSVMYVYCVENPDKGAWSEAFRCGEGPSGGVRALGVVGSNKTDGAHTHRGRVIFFACAWENSVGPGPDGIWGKTVYNEGVGTPGIIRGTCGEQYYSP